MKTKLLRKIRKDYKIYYYPNGNSKCSYEDYRDKEHWKFLNSNTSESYEDGDLDKVWWVMMNIIRTRYRKYTRKYKLGLNKIQIWYVGKK